jgi:hypothetical protein
MPFPPLFLGGVDRVPLEPLPLGRYEGVTVEVELEPELVVLPVELEGAVFCRGSDGAIRGLRPSGGSGALFVP